MIGFDTLYDNGFADDEIARIAAAQGRIVLTRDRELLKRRTDHPRLLRARAAFGRVAPDVVRRLDQEHADRTDFKAIGRVIAPWGRRIGDLRFKTEGAWKRSGTTVDSLAKELRLALQYPEGAAV